MLRRNLALAVALAVAASLMLAGAALAADRNHDRIPDRWEKRHHLSLKVKQGRRDQDHDGLRNRGEFKARLNPRDADTDDDGVKDGDENAGRVDSFKDGVLTIALARGGKLSGAVTRATEIECDDDAGDDRGRGRHDESGDHHGGDEPGDDHGGDGRAARHDDPDDEGNEDCGRGALVAGRTVLEAELQVRRGKAVWTEVELFRR